MRVNFFGTLYCTHFALPHVKERRGSLVAVSSLCGKRGIPVRAYSPVGQGPLLRKAGLADIAKRHGATLLLVCPNMAESTVYRSRNKGGFYDQLAHNKVPSFLEPLPLLGGELPPKPAPVHRRVLLRLVHEQPPGRLL